MFQRLLKHIKIDVNETVSQLLHEIPGLSKEDIAVLQKALDDGTIQDKLPPYNEMIYNIIYRPGSKVKKISFKDVSPKDIMGQGDVAGEYIKQVLLPIAQGRRPSKAAPTLTLKTMTEEQREQLDHIIFDIVTMGYIDQFMEMSKSGNVWWVDAATQINNDYNSGDPFISQLLREFEEDDPGSTEVFTGLSNTERRDAIIVSLRLGWNEMKELY